MFQNIRALIVEDSLTDAMVLKTLLEGLGITAELIDVDDAVTALRNHEPADIIFIDFDLPGTGTSGFEILKELQGDPQFENVRMVAYTAHLSEIKAANQAGFHSFIGKPLSSGRLADQLQRIMNGESVWEVR